MLKGKAGFSLVELMIAAMVFALAVGTLLLVFIGCLSLNSLSQSITTAMNGAQAKIEEIYSHDFNTVVSDYAAGATPGDNDTISNWSALNSRIVSIVDDASDPDGLTCSDLIQITVSVCWKERGGRVIGEDSNLNGNFDVTSEDQNGNGLLDSPAQITTLIAMH